MELIFRYSQSNQWQRCFITVSLKMDGLSVASPIQDPAPGLGSRSGLCFPGWRFFLGVILRRPVAANVLAANGGEASKFTLAAESNCTEHLLMNERAAHYLRWSRPADEKFNVLLAGTLVLHNSPEPTELY